MPEPVHFLTPTQHLGRPTELSAEYAIAVIDESGEWTLLRMTYRTRAAAEAALPADAEAIVIVRDVSPWRQVLDLLPRPNHDAHLDGLVADIVAGEHAQIRAALTRGAEVAVTGVGKPGARVGHRIGCQSLEGVLDRNIAWATHLRSRLLEDRNFRVSLPNLMTRDEARRVTRITSCALCLPQLFDEPLKTRTLRAENLKTHHIGLTLSDEVGADRGTIHSIDLHKDAVTSARWDVDVVRVATDHGMTEFAGKDTVILRTSPDTKAIAARERRIRLNVGLRP